MKIEKNGKYESRDLRQYEYAIRFKRFVAVVANYITTVTKTIFRRPFDVLTESLKSMKKRKHGSLECKTHFLSWRRKKRNRVF